MLNLSRPIYRPLLLICCLLLCLPVSAGIYRQVDEHGNVTYSDTPQGEAVEAVDLPPINSQPPPQVQPARKQNKTAAPTDYRLTILAPASGAHVPAGQRDIQIQVRVEPRLAEGQRLQARLNGSNYGESTTLTSLVLHDVYRGEHQISVALYDRSGRLLASSPPVVVFVHRPSVNRAGGN